jgi:hypothetical protein
MKYLKLNQFEKRILVGSLTKYMKDGDWVTKFNVEGILNKLEKLD